MNTTYCSIWNESLGAWVAASENTRARGKRGGSRVAAAPGALTLLSSGHLRAGIMTALMALGGMAAPSLAQAQSVNCTASPYNYYNGTASCMGWQSQATADGATALGYQAIASLNWATAVGYQTVASAQYSVAIGRLASATGPGGAIAIGSSTI